MMARSGGARALLAVFLGVVLALAVTAPARADADESAIHVVLIGAQGNLAKKYLWQSFFRLSIDPTLEGKSLYVWPGSRAAEEKGQEEMDKIVREHIQCIRDVDFIHDSEKFDCEAMKEHFIRERVMQYTQLRNDEHYSVLAQRIRDHNSKSERVEVGRLFYLSIPPKAYANVTAAISQHAHPGNSENGEEGVSESAWVRAVLEKPFGSDLPSALAMADHVGEALDEEEIYRVDHYLGKDGVRAIIDFRRANPAYNRLLAGKHVARLEVVMKEQEDCAGRAGYYDDYGVVRDIHQNHLSEIMSLIMLDLPATEEEEDGKAGDGEIVDHDPEDDKLVLGMMKSYVYEDIAVPVPPEHVVLGQYKGYQGHVEVDRAKWMKDEEMIRQRTRTPTFAAVRLEATSPAWNGVPIVMVAGKALDERAAYARLIFKNGQELVFNIQGGSAGTSISATDGLPAMNPLPGWIQGSSHSLKIAGVATQAYDVLTRAAVLGQREHFVSTDTLMASWKLWTPVLHLAEGGADSADKVPLIEYEEGGAQVFKASRRLFVVGHASKVESKEEL